MSKFFGTGTIIVIILCAIWWFNRYPSFKSKGVADVSIYEKDSLIYHLPNVAPGDFIFNLKQEPRYMIFNYEGAEVRLDESNTHYSVRIDYIDQSIDDINFM